MLGYVYEFSLLSVVMRTLGIFSLSVPVAALGFSLTASQDKCSVVDLDHLSPLVQLNIIHRLFHTFSLQHSFMVFELLF